MIKLTTIRASAAGLGLLLGACSSTGDSDFEGGSGLDDPYETASEVSGSDGATDGSSADGGTLPDEGTGGGTGGDGSSTGSGDDDPPDPGAEFAGCPDRTPSGWVFCEDFENMADPAEVFFEYQDDYGAFALDDAEGASGDHSMRASYRAGEEGAGWLSVSFGENPVVDGTGRPQYEEAGAFEEVYWRLRIKMQPGWPDQGPHKLARLTAFADPEWSEAMVAHLYSNGDDVVLAGDAATCVYGAEVPCEGVGDMSGLESLGLLVGETPLFSESYAGQWHCVEAHVRLNTPGMLDGVFEFWVDGALESTRQDLDWRGTWTDYGINLLSIENFWTGGAPEDLDRWIDDIVISTDPIGCE